MNDYFKYYASGNLERQFGISGIADYSYNSRNLLTGITGGISYTYDHAGHRVEQNISGQETHYLWDEFSQYGDVVLETNAYNQYERHYSLANGMLIS
jgi:YD repeat-containing protein